MPAEEVLKIFDEYKVKYEEFKEKQHEILSDPWLIVWIENDLYDWKTGIIKLLSLLVFKTPLEEKRIETEELVLEGLEEDNQEDPINPIMQSPEWRKPNMEL